VTEDQWRPLDIDSEEEVAEYDALHDGVPEWMSAAFWAWVREAISHRRTGYNNRSHEGLRESEVERMAQMLRIALPNLRVREIDYSSGQNQISSAMKVLRASGKPLQIADYLLAHFSATRPAELEALLERSKSVRAVGTRAGKPGLVRRIPLGVQSGADEVIGRAGRAGVRLAKAWEELYGLTPNPSEAYRLAILAVEDCAVPVVSPKNSSATLGTVLRQMEDQGDWRLPMGREHSKAASREVVLGMMRLLWHGQHDRHGGQPTAPGNVTQEEAVVAVGVATTLVHWFDAGLVSRSADPTV
jgi:hypothetical protein